MYKVKEIDLPKTVAPKTSEIFSFFSDIPGGRWPLAILCELLQEMIDTENWLAAEVIVKEIYQVAEVNFPGGPIDPSDIQMFCDLLTDCIMETEEMK